MEVHRRVGLFEVTLDAEPLEFTGLHVDPVLGKLTAFLAEFVDRHLVLVLALGAVGFLDLPFDRQAVAIPARNIVGIITAHLERAGDDVLQDLVERVTDMDVAVGIGRAVVEHIFRPAGGRGAELLVEVHLLPALYDFRLLLGKAGAHREIGLRQVKRLGIIDLVGGIGHDIGLSGIRLGRAEARLSREFELRVMKRHRPKARPPAPLSQRARKTGTIIRIALPGTRTGHVERSAVRMGAVHNAFAGV